VVIGAVVGGANGFFLFVDIAGSTALAERIGPAAVHRFLGEVFRLASDPIEDHRGEVHQYVVAFFFAIEEALARAAPAFEREFGFVIEGLGLQRLRGRAAAMHVYAVAAKPSPNGGKTR
jgi:class 3 adenylate cyclase